MAARSIWTMLEDLGVEVLGPVPGVDAAIELANATEFDGAVLDIELGNETSEAVATRLDQLGVPFMFISGAESSQAMLRNEAFRSRRLLTKPIEPAMLEQALAEEFHVRAAH
jgi:CheY-like chemotaxis protein